MRIVLLITILTLSACSSVRQDVRSPSGVVNPGAVTSYARSLIGVPYKYGGSTPETGFDCSGFVSYVYKQSIGLSLPRSTRLLSQEGKPIMSSQLREGDLVFFDTNKRSFSHVGIYLGDERFIHAPSSGGSVRIVDMSSPYWKKHYNGARRITSTY